MSPSDTDSEAGATRKLSAVMFTDIKGFSRKMAENESGAFDLLKKHDALLRVLTTKFGGKVIKSIGDSFMVDFSSAVNAVKCAIDAQKKFYNHNKGKSEFNKIEIRVGIHLGDVLIRGEDIFGDGVNIASRVESITAPTRICISQDVYNQVRNKMPMQVFRIGPMTLKNIPEPVEVYEILIEEIPEFAGPSTLAQEQSKSKSFDTGVKRESEEALEAKRVEEAKQRAAVQGDLPEGDKKKLVEEIYARAEKYYQVGHIAEAEAELKKIEEIDPNYTPSENQRKEEEERETKAQQHLRKARELIAQKNLEEAEREVNKVFEYFPLHVGAQQILMRIEEDRYLREQEVRAKKAQEEKERARQEHSEEQKKFDDLLSKARGQFEAREYTEAVYTLREVFMIDPNNAAARQLEDEIRIRQQTKMEEDKRLAEEEVQQAQEERQAALERKAEEIKVAKPVHHEERRKPFPMRLVLTIAGVIIFAGAAVELGPKAWRAVFPKTIDVAVLPFTTSDAGLSRDPLLAGISALITDDIGRLAHARVVAFESSSRADMKSGNGPQIASSLGVSSLLTGSIEQGDDGFEATIRLVNTTAQQVRFTRKFRFFAGTVDQFRLQLVKTVIAASELDDAPVILPLPQMDVDARMQFIRASALVGSEDPRELEMARDLMQSLTILPKPVPAVQALWAEALARLFRFGLCPEDSLADALAAVQEAVKGDGRRPEVLRAYGAVLLAARRYSSVSAPLAQSLSIFPFQAECHRLLCEVSIVGGSVAAADAALTQAEAIDPRNPRTLFLRGLLEHWRNNEVSAATWYEKAIKAGGNARYITSSFLSSAWLRGSKPNTLVVFFKNELDSRPGDFRTQYLLGRAYAEQLDSSQKHFEAGLALVNKAIETNDQDLTAHVYRALFLSQLGKFQDALESVDRVARTNPGPSLLYRIANVYALQKKKSDVLRVLKPALDRRYELEEVLNPDFGGLLQDPEFLSLVARPITSITSQ